MSHATRQARRALLAAAVVVAVPAAGGAQTADDSLAYRPLAEREQLEQLAARLAKAEAAQAPSATRAYVANRLKNGDFRPGDLVIVNVQGEEALSDTFTVNSDLALALPAPAVGELPLHGVLRAEAQDRVAAFVQQFVRSAVVRVRPLMRFSVQGEVANAGYHGVPADAVLADVLMAAGGTTAQADMKTLRIERNGKPVLKGKTIHRLIAEGKTVDETLLRGGETIAVGRKPQGTFTESLRLVSIVVSIAGGLYGLSRAVR